jgi:alpha-glucoside transport system substrate-binding protein
MTPLRCQDCWPLVLDRHRSQAIEHHLATCSVCAQMIAGTERAAAAVRDSIPAPEPGLDARVLAAVEQDAKARRRRRLSVPHLRASRPRRQLAALALASFALALAITAGALPGGRSEPAEASAVPIDPLTAACGSDSGRLVVAGTWSGSEGKSFARVLGRFERRSGIRVSYAYETHDIAAKLGTRIDRGCPPDVALLPQPGLVDELAREGQIQPLDRATRTLVAHNYSSGWRQLTEFRSKAYGVWFKAADKSTVWYRTDAFRRAGIAHPPRTWAGLLDDVSALHRTGLEPLAVGGADGWTLTDWFENVYLGEAGAARYQLLAQHRIPWTDPSVVAALRRLAGLLGTPALTGGSAESLRTSFEGSVNRVFGPRANAAIVFEGDFVRSFLPASSAAREAGMFPFPARRSTGRAPVVVGGDVAVAFDREARSRQLMRFLATPAAAEPWARHGGFVSPNRDFDRTAYPDPLTRQVADALIGARTVRFDLSDQQPPAFGAIAHQGMWSILQHFLANPNEVGATARRLESAASAAWACERANHGRC